MRTAAVSTDPVPARGEPRPRVLLAATAVVVVLLALPPVFLLIEAYGAGLSTVWHLIYRELTATLLRNSLELGVVVTALCAIVGTAAAFAVERTDLPWRPLWTTLLIMPLAIPDFVVAFGWSSLTNWIEGFRGAVVVMTLALYPLVFLPVAASLRNSDPGQEEVARSLGVGRLETFRRITLGQARGAVLGGCLLVVLVLFAEYGAFEIIGFRTFSTEIYIEFNVAFDVSAAAALSLALVALCIVVLTAETLAQGRGRAVRSGRLAQRFGRPHRLGAARFGVFAGLTLLVGLSVGVPLYATIRWTFGRAGLIVDSSALLNAAWHTVLYSAPAAAIATLMALPVALLVVRHPGRANRFLERSTYLVLAMPLDDRLLALVLHRSLRERLRLPERSTARARLRDPLLPVRARRRARLGEPGAGRARGGRPLARAAAGRRARPGHPPTPRPRPRRGVLPRLPLVGDRADDDPDPDPDRVADALHPVLVVPAESAVRPGGAVRARDDRGRRDPGVHSRPVLLADRGVGLSRLEVGDLHKSFGAHPVLAGLELTVAAESFTAILGASGSGKTTLLRVLAGFERPDRGTISIGGNVVDGDGRHVRPEQRRIGYVPQEGTLFPHLTVEANVGFGLRRAARRSRVAELLGLVGLGGLGARYPQQLSGGQQQRVALARALAIEPGVVLLDEPFASLDTNLRSSVREDVRSILRASGTTTILVTHDQDEALSLADSIAVLRDGKIAQFATPEVVYGEPADAGLAAFVGLANLLEGTIAGGKVETAARAPRRRGAAATVGNGCDGADPARAARRRAGGWRGHRSRPSRGLPRARHVLHLETVRHDRLVARSSAAVRPAAGTEVGLTVTGPVRVWSR